MKISGTRRRNGTIRCGIYTRKSSEEGLEQEFNSLQAQREACEAFIDSQRHEGWVCLRTPYDDGGFSGATMDRPALHQLLADITAGRVDTVVVYKIDRLTRSLAILPRLSRSSMRGSVLRIGDAAVQHDHLDGALDPERSVVLRAVRAARSSASAFATRSPPRRRRGCGWARAAARVWSAGPQARHDRQRGGYRSIDLPFQRCRQSGSPPHTCAGVP
jgi:hypothetical protein